MVAFLVANPPVLLPQVWSYLNAYMGEKLLVHSGYLFADHLYINQGFQHSLRHSHLFLSGVYGDQDSSAGPGCVYRSAWSFQSNAALHPGYAFALFMFLLWIVPYSLIGAKWLRYTLSLMPFVYMLAAIGVIELIRFMNGRLKFAAQGRAVVSAILVVIFLGLPAWTAYSAGPHYALYTNALGRNHIGYFFPHDEFYDDRPARSDSVCLPQCSAVCDHRARNAGSDALLSTQVWPRRI